MAEIVFQHEMFLKITTCFSVGQTILECMTDTLLLADLSHSLSTEATDSYNTCLIKSLNSGTVLVETAVVSITVEF